LLRLGPKIDLHFKKGASRSAFLAPRTHRTVCCFKGSVTMAARCLVHLDRNIRAKRFPSCAWVWRRYKDRGGPVLSKTPLAVQFKCSGLHTYSHAALHSLPYAATYCTLLY
jgi:hypothetical protein